MLKIVIQASEHFDSDKNQFITIEDDVELELEHSLVSVSLWESQYERAFLSNQAKTEQELAFYIKCMSKLDVDDRVLANLSPKNVSEINDYIHKKHSATRFLAQPSGNESREKVTAELIYYWMITLQIPWEAQNWHLERLLTLIEVCQRKNQQASGKAGHSGNKAARARQLRQMNAANRARYGSAG